jgi:archaellum biogenesis ATPase FlaH
MPFSRTSLAPLVFHFYLVKEYLSETRIIINNNKTIFVTVNAYVRNKTKQVHM